MTSVSQFAQYLLKLDPQRNQARLTLYNYLRNILDPDLPFSPAIIQGFYSRVLQFEHWQNNANHLSDTIKTDLANFTKDEAWKSLRHADTLQVVNLKVFADLEQLVNSEHQTRQKSGDRIQTLKISETQILVLILSQSGGLEVKVYPAQALVWGAQLRLAAPLSHLFYSSELELMPHVHQLLDGNLLTTHCFYVDHEGAHGLITRGYSFQKFETYIRAKLSDTHDLFSGLKKLERHFINPQSDPYYQDVVSRLEKANRFLALPSANLMEAERVLNRGKQILKTAFPNDRLLTLLVTHLEYGIDQRRGTSPQ